MEKRNILLGQNNDGLNFEGENTQSIIFGDRSQNENNNAGNHTTETEKINKKREIVLAKSGVRNINVSDITFERMWKSCYRFINITKLNRAKILKQKYNANTYKISKDLFQYSGNQLPEIRLINVDLNYSRCSLLLRNLLSEKLNSSCNSKIVCNFIRNTFPEFDHPKKIRNFVISLSQENTSIKTERIMEELFRMYKKYKNLSSEKRTPVSQKDYCYYEMDVKNFLRFLFENLFNVEIKSDTSRMISHSDVSYDKKKKLSNLSCFGNSNHIIAESDVKCELDSTYLINSYSSEEDVPQEQEFMTASTTNFEAEIPLLVNKTPSIDDQIFPDFANHWFTKVKCQTPENVGLQDLTKDSASNFEPQISLEVNKKSCMDNQMFPYVVDSCYSQANYRNSDDTCLQDFMKESTRNFKSQAPLLINKKSLIDDEILPDFDDPYYNKTKHQNQESICLQDLMAESASKFESQSSLLVNKNPPIDDDILPDFAYPFYNKAKYQNSDVMCLRDFTKEPVGNSESRTPLLVNKKNLIDYHIPPDLVYPCYSQRKNENSEDICQNFTKESPGNFELKTHLLLDTQNLGDDHIPLGTVTDTFSSNIKIRYHSKHYYKVYYKYLIDQNFYKLRKETRTKISKTKTSKHNRDKQCYNQTQNNINSNYNVANKNDKTDNRICLKNNTSDNILKQYGFCNETSSNSNTSALPKISENFNTISKAESPAKHNKDKQSCNQTQNNINSNYNLANKNDKTYNRICLKNNTSDNNLKKYGFCNETSNNSNTSDVLPKISENFNSSIPKTESPTKISDIFLLNSDSFDVSNKSVNELPKTAEKVVQPTFKTDEKHTDHIISITDSTTEIYYSCSEENSELNILRTVPSYSNSCNKVNCNEKVFNSPTAVVKGYAEGKRKLFGDVKIDNVKRVFNILGPSFKPDAVRRLNGINNQTEEICQVPSNRLNEISSSKRKLFSDPKGDNVRRVRHILDPRYKYEATSSSLNASDMQSEVSHLKQYLPVEE